MAVEIVNDTKNLKPNIYQIKLSDYPFLDIPFLEEIIKSEEIGIKKDYYYMVNTTAGVGWLQPTQQLQDYHNLLREYRNKGFALLMINTK